VFNRYNKLLRDGRRLKMRKSFICSIVLMAIIFALNVSLAGAYTFVPADPADTDSAILVDNFKVLINGVPINPNGGFESGTLTYFNHDGDIRVIGSLGSIAPPNGNYFAIVTTGPGAGFSSYPFHFDCSNLWQPISINTGDQVIVSFDYNFLTNEDNLNNHGNDWFNAHVGGEGFHFNIADENVGYSTFTPAPGDTGFLFQTGFKSVDMDITQALAEPLSQGIHDFSINLNICEEVVLPSLELNLNQTNFNTGETLIVTAHVTNGPLPLDVDAKIFTHTPPPGPPPAKTLRLPIIKISDLHQNANDDFTVEVFRYTFDGTEPRGWYNVGGNLIDSIDGRWYGDEWKNLEF
jgi:hypothetical protein